MTSQPHPVTLVGGGPGAWDLITLRGARALAEAEVILTDHLGPTADLGHIIGEEALAGKELIDVSKLPYGKSVAQEEINRLLITHARAGRRVARLKGGDPFVFGRGFEEIQALAAAGLAWEVIPGVTSPVAVPTAAGIPITHRGVVHSFLTISGHVPPDSPRSLTDWEAAARLARRGTTLAVIMGVRNVGAITAALIGHGLDPATPAVAITEGTTAREVVVRSSVGKLADAMHAHAIAAPTVYLIGAVAGLEAGLDGETRG